MLSENKYKRVPKGNFVLIEKRGKDNDLFATEINTQLSSVVNSKNSNSFM